ncbi:MAG: L-2-hydroxyglutarate oxidase [Chitinophagales bacterium]
MTMKYDVIIIGAGIVGLSTAYNLLQQSPNIKLLILEKESTVAAHQSGHNSGVIHSGIYYPPNSIKAKNCIKGYQLLLKFCDDYLIDYKICGKLIVATATSELEQLKVLLERGKANGLANLEWLEREEMEVLEPNINGIAAIHVPQAGIVDYKVVAAKMKEIIEANGGTIHLNEKVIGIQKQLDVVEIKTDKGNYVAKKMINCGGLYSDQLTQLSHQKIEHQIVPFRGEYYRLKPNKKHLVKRLVYPVPNPNFPFLGVHLTPTIYGEVECGPNAVLAFKREGYRFRDFKWEEFVSAISYSGFYHLAKKFWRTGLTEMKQSLSKKAFTKAVKNLLPSITQNDLEKSGSGVRAQALRKDGSMVDDFLIYENGAIINVCNTPSPAATASLQIGKQIAEIILNKN